MERKLTNKKVLLGLINNNGYLSQMSRLTEECGEFIVAKEHFIRNRINLIDVYKEIADIHFVTSQFITANPDIFKPIMDELFEKGEHRIKTNNYEGHL